MQHSNEVRASLEKYFLASKKLNVCNKIIKFKINQEKSL